MFLFHDKLAFFFQGMDYLISHNLVEDDPFEIAQFLHSTKRLHPDKRREFLDKRYKDLIHNVSFLINNFLLCNLLRGLNKEYFIQVKP